VEVVSDEAKIQIQSPSTSSASKKKNPPEEIAGETQLVEPKGKCHRKNPLLPGFSLERHQASLPWMT
jgi:hypothetical protein